MRRAALSLVLASAGLGLGACAHNDVLVFGTDTAIALDVQTAATQGASPSITVGYKRKEGVWLPLLVNGRDSTVTPPCTVQGNVCKPTAGNGWDPGKAKYTSMVKTTTKDGTVQESTEALSVFASLGAKFNGSASTANGAQAGGGLAQFFATGSAAVQISQNAALVTALKSDANPEAAKAQADAVKAAAENQTLTSIKTGLSTDAAAKATVNANQALGQHQRRVGLVMACAIQKDGTYRWSGIVDQLAGVSAADKAIYKKYPQNELQSDLTADPALTKLALDAGVMTFMCTGEG